MCSQARGYKLYLNLAVQYGQQLGVNAASVKANVATHIAFKSHDYKDCGDLAKEFSGGLEAVDFQKLPLYHFYMRTPFNGEEAIIRGETLLPNKIISNPTTIEKRSQQLYAMSRADVVKNAFGAVSPEREAKEQGLLKILRGQNETV
jgi:hypothetical protein